MDYSSEDQKLLGYITEKSRLPQVIERGGWFWASYKDLSEATGLSMYKIRQTQKRLSTLIQIKVGRYKGKTITWYRLKPASKDS